MIDLNSKSLLTDRINYFIDEALMAEQEKEAPRAYLGASVVGHECERAVQFNLLATMGEVERKPVEPRIRRIFDRGNVYEEKARRWLKDAGFIFGYIPNAPIKYIERTGPLGTLRVGHYENSFEDFDGRFRGHADGVVTGWKNQTDRCPIFLPALWECKCLGSKGFKAIERDGLKKYSQTYWYQIHVYMGQLGLDRTLYTIVNADTMELLHLNIEFDKAVFDDAMKRIERVLLATDLGEMVPRCTSDRNYYLCKSFCDFYGRCWS